MKPKFNWYYLLIPLVPILIVLILIGSGVEDVRTYTKKGLRNLREKMGN